MITPILSAAPFSSTQLVQAASARDYQGTILKPQDEREQIRPAVLSSSSPTPSVLSQGEDVVTAQGSLASLQVRPSSNIVGTNVYYNIQFRPSTTGEIDKIRMEFPEGTYLGNAKVLEVEGIGKGRPVGEWGSNILIYDVHFPEVVPAGTEIRLDLANIANPPTPSLSNTVTVTTVDSSSLVIDGPTVSATYTLRQIVTDQIANNAITASKMSPTFMTSKILQDGQNGWNPDAIFGLDTFTITDSAVKASNSHVYVSVDESADVGPLAVNVVCMVEDIVNNQFQVVCNAPPADGSVLRYTVINQP
ncbi:MAG: hypothetical protein GEU26_07615 [Nitrososphaeraceae archaeon]|nr:hypothetical protein [Nitrososphaeraceae archaeon]